MTNVEIRAELKRRFPWLNTDEDGNGAETVDAVCAWYDELTEQSSREINGFDYENQAWVVNGRYVSCGHPEAMNCGCFGRIHAGESPAANAEFHPTEVPSDAIHEVTPTHDCLCGAFDNCLGDNLPKGFRCTR